MDNAGHGFAPEVRHALAALMARIGQQASDDPRSVVRAAELFEGTRRGDELHRLLLDLVPADIDPGQWHDWLDGGAAVHVPPRLVDPDQGRKPGARGAHASAARRREEAARALALLEDKVAHARALLADAEVAEQAAASHLRQVVAHRVLTDISRQLAGAFSMGPAWTVMRAVSGYIRDDHALGEGMDEQARAHVQSLLDTASKDSTEMLDLLDLHAGDTLLELRLRAAVLSVLRKHHEPVKQELSERNYDHRKLSPAARRVHRKTAERKAAIRPSPGIVSDRHDVLGGFPLRHQDDKEEQTLDVFQAAAAAEEEPF
ncbi:hypothetical protein [Sphingomonas carotinifaciens]|uniref:Uncharacterized protein n=2 Tax=Sphingomonas carotinifaciens TaxID=1166323 RepID=A0A1G7RT65_9SPHN|nr:hypothetical protein [Sphingomonas carotinifaciens]MBB4088130.1 hypothetical protein [Sphingomonas carotinifaciens]SDG13988.1 hypothetical protein SAMN05216557_11417 [Sphingomonas carotinifaciens]